MGQKANPISIRLLIDKNWKSRWYANQKYRHYLTEDLQIRDRLLKKMGTNAAISSIDIERDRDNITVKINSARPGIIIGRSGQGANELKIFVKKIILKTNPNLKIKIEIIEIKNPELSASLVAQNIGAQISKRISYRRSVKQAIEKTISKGAKGIKVSIAGRLGGAEIARTEKFGQGTIPLGNFRANIDYALYHALTTYGIIGVKVWIYLGDKRRIEE